MFRNIFIIFAGYLLFSSCERISNNSVSKLLFSSDTIYFDTVFSSVGTVTKELRVINPGDKDLVVDHIFLAGGKTSRFRLNIDGEPVNEKFNVKLDAGDSIFIFVDAYINPSGNYSPVAVSDSINFSLKNNKQSVQLLAWGQDINLIKNRLTGIQIWQKGRPYVIYDNVVIDTSAILTIGEGTRIYFHKNASLTVAGTLNVNGTTAFPVLFASDRLEKMYEDIPGQWKGILILNTSNGNYIRNAIMRNAVYGIQLGEPKSGTDYPDLKLFSTTIAHSSASGLSAVHGSIEAANCEIIHCGNYCIYVASGGDYTFTNCTFYNRWEYGLRITPLFLINEKPEKPEVTPGQINLHLNNSIVFGENVSEIDIIPLASNFTGNYYFDHCLIRLDTLHSKFWDRNKFPGTIINKSPRFIDSDSWDLRPDTLSPLINNGNPVYSLLYPLDIRGVSRLLNGSPDIGAYERIAGEHKKE
jgi:hypothetical protein